jgi:LysR family transcriptional activator of dmlA
LLAFVLVAKHSSFTLAAKAQRQTPMAMSKQVTQLENRLQEPLFERSTRKISLTEFGEEFLLRAQKILDQHDSLAHWLEARRGEFVGTLKVLAQDAQTYDETIFPWLAPFNRQYPDIKLVFEVKESLIDINHDAYDIYWGVSDYLGINHPGLKRRSLCKGRLGIFAAPSYLNTFGPPQTPDELQNHRIISHPKAQPANALAVNTKANSSQQEMECMILEAPIKTVAGQSKLAVQGLGLINALEDNHDIKAYLANGELVPVLEQYWHNCAELYLYYQQVKLEQPKVRAFIDFFLANKKDW